LDAPVNLPRLRNLLDRQRRHLAAGDDVHYHIVVSTDNPGLPSRMPAQQPRQIRLAIRGARALPLVGRPGLGFWLTALDVGQDRGISMLVDRASPPQRTVAISSELVWVA